jgi:hypothetical protein
MPLTGFPAAAAIVQGAGIKVIDDQNMDVPGAWREWNMPAIERIKIKIRPGS